MNTTTSELQYFQLTKKLAKRFSINYIL